MFTVNNIDCTNIWSSLTPSFSHRTDVVLANNLQNRDKAEYLGLDRDPGGCRDFFNEKRDLVIGSCQTNEARGTNGWLCYPYSTTLKKTDKVNTIGIPAWINRGYDGYEDVTDCHILLLLSFYYSDLGSVPTFEIKDHGGT